MAGWLAGWIAGFVPSCVHACVRARSTLPPAERQPTGCATRAQRKPRIPIEERSIYEKNIRPTLETRCYEKQKSEREREREGGEVGGVGSRAAQKNAGEKDEKRSRKREGVVRLQLERIPRPNVANRFYRIASILNVV